MTPATEPLTAQGQYIVDDWATGDTQRKQLTEQVLASEAAAGSRATEGLNREWAKERDLIYEDLGDILRALGLFDGAQPISAHAVVQTKILPRIAILRGTVGAGSPAALATGAASPAEPAKPSARSLVCSIGEHTKCDGHAPNGDLGYPCSCNCHTLSPIPAQPASEPLCQECGQPFSGSDGAHNPTCRCMYPQLHHAFIPAQPASEPAEDERWRHQFPTLRETRAILEELRWAIRVLNSCHITSESRHAELCAISGETAPWAPQPPAQRTGT